jgi:hypothetical protein
MLEQVFRDINSKVPVPLHGIPVPLYRYCLSHSGNSSNLRDAPLYLFSRIPDPSRYRYRYATQHKKLLIKYPTSATYGQI